MLFLSGRAAFAAAECAAGETSQACFDRAFARLCAASDPQPSLCVNGKQDHRWLLLSEHCASHAGEPCELFTSANAKDSGLAPTVLAYDHPSGIWNARNALDGDRIEKDAAGKPTVSLQPDEELVVVVENTNPLLYTLTAGAVTETTIPELTELQKLAGLLGGNLQAFLRVAADESESLSGSGLEDFIDSLRDKAMGLQTATAQVKCLVEQTAARSSQIADFVQAVELQRDATFSLAPPVCGSGAAQVALSVSSMSAGFESLSLAYRDVADTALTCTPLLEPVVRLAGGDTGKLSDLQKAILDFDTLDRQL